MLSECRCAFEEEGELVVGRETVPGLWRLLADRARAAFLANWRPQCCVVTGIFSGGESVWSFPPPHFVTAQQPQHAPLPPFRNSTRTLRQLPSCVLLFSSTHLAAYGWDQLSNASSYEIDFFCHINISKKYGICHLAVVIEQRIYTKSSNRFRDVLTNCPSYSMVRFFFSSPSSAKDWLVSCQPAPPSHSS